MTIFLLNFHIHSYTILDRLEYLYLVLEGQAEETDENGVSGNVKDVSEMILLEYRELDMTLFRKRGAKAKTDVELGCVPARVILQRNATDKKQTERVKLSFLSQLDCFALVPKPYRIKVTVVIYYSTIK